MTLAQWLMLISSIEVATLIVAIIAQITLTIIRGPTLREDEKTPR
jgi:hypothetical protein